MKMSVHSDVNVLYIELREGEQVRTLEVNSNSYLDLDAESRVRGVEVLNAREFLGDFWRGADNSTCPAPSFRNRLSRGRSTR